MIRHWARLHREIPWVDRLHDYFTCQDCEVDGVPTTPAQWDDPVVRCQVCKRVLIQGEPGSCPICGSMECAARVDEEQALVDARSDQRERALRVQYERQVLLAGGLPCGHDPREERAEVDDDMGGSIWCAECDDWWLKPEDGR